MTTLKFLLFSVLLSAVLGKGKIKELQNEIKDLNSLVTQLTARIDALEGAETEEDLARLNSRLLEMKEERAELDRAHAWQALHMAASAACRGSTPTGGHGRWSNTVLAKENTRSCSAICGETAFNMCDADISISGYLGRAKSYNKALGYFYNYGCATAGNTRVEFDEVKADEDGVFNDDIFFFRFCCCRHQ